MHYLSIIKKKFASIFFSIYLFLQAEYSVVQVDLGGSAMGRKTTLWIVQVIDWQDYTRNDLDLSEKKQIDSLLILS